MSAFATQSGHVDSHISTNHPKVRGIVYLSARVPDSDESAAELLTRWGAPMEGLSPDKNGMIWLDDANAYANVMATDVSAIEVQQLAAVQQPIAATAFTENAACSVA